MSETLEGRPPGPTYQTPYEALGEVGVRRLVDAFYDAMAHDPSAAELRRMHASDLGPMRERLSDWLVGWMGGPRVYAQRHPGRPCVVSAHGSLRISAREAEQWMHCMRQALEETAAPPALAAMLEPAFAQMCEALTNA